MALPTTPPPVFNPLGPGWTPMTRIGPQQWRAAPPPPPGPPPANLAPLLGASRVVGGAAPIALRAAPAFFANPYFWGPLAAGALIAGGLYLMNRENPGPITFDHGGMQGPAPMGTAGELFYRWTFTAKGMFEPVLPAVRAPAQGWYSIGPVPQGWSAVKRRVPRSDPAEADFYLDVTWPGGGVSVTMGSGLSNVHSLYLRPPGQPAPSNNPDKEPYQDPPAFQPPEIRPPYVAPIAPPGPIVYLPGGDGAIAPFPVEWTPFDYDPPSPGQRTPTVPRQPIISGRAGPWNFYHDPQGDEWVWLPNPQQQPGIYFPPRPYTDDSRVPTPIFLPDRSGEVNNNPESPAPLLGPLSLRLRGRDDCCPNPFGQNEEPDCATKEDVLKIVQSKKLVLERRLKESLTDATPVADSGQLSVPWGDYRVVKVVATAIPESIRRQSGGSSAPDVLYLGWITGCGVGDRLPISHASQEFVLPPLTEGTTSVTFTFTGGARGVVSYDVDRYELKEAGDPVPNPPM